MSYSEIDLAEAAVREFEEFVAKQAEVGWTSTMQEIDTLTILLDAKGRLRRLRRDAVSEYDIADLHERLIEIETQRSTVPQRLGLILSDDGLPRNGHQYRILNPFVDISNPAPFLACDLLVGPDQGFHNVRFKNYTPRDIRNHWRFNRIGERLYNIKCVKFDDERVGFLRNTNLADADGQAGNPNTALHVDFSPDGTAYQISDPNDPERMLWAAFAGREYFAVFGHPHVLFGGDVHFDEVVE